MKITGVRIRRINMPRVDPAWRTASYARNAVEGFILEVDADGTTGIGGTAAHPSNISGDQLETQLNGHIRSALLGSNPLSGNAIRDTIRRANVHTRASIAADLALYDLAVEVSTSPGWGLKLPA